MAWPTTQETDVTAIGRRKGCGSSSVENEVDLVRSEPMLQKSRLCLVSEQLSSF